jgi:hypothetical protein
MMKDEVSGIQLRSCPFCDEKVKLHHGCSGNPFISCSNCRLDMGGDSENEVIKKWNRRQVNMKKVIKMNEVVI